MDAVEIARWQFGITTVYHFLMVPLTIGLSVLVAVLQTMWYRTKKDEYLRATKFWGKLFLINFIMGVATGIVQEFQFGMAWSEYSKFVGDVFGAPLAMEALLAFFVESTFIGLWIFGWKRLPKGVHLACIWLASLATWLSACFILVANSFMQHPVGIELVDGRATLTSILAVMTNNTAMVTILHVITGSLSVAGTFLFGISWFHLYRRRRDGIDTVDANNRVIAGESPAHGAGRDKADHRVWLRSLRLGGLVSILAFVGVALSGHMQAQLMFDQQPLKMASAEAACHEGTGLSLLTFKDPGKAGPANCGNVSTPFEIPGLLSYLVHEDFTTPVEGVNTLIPKYEKTYGTHIPDNPLYGEYAGKKIDYQPMMFVTYWGFRLMIFFGAVSAGISAIGLWMTRKGTVPKSKWLSRLSLVFIAAPFLANSFGWIFTEMGRQPFVVAPNPNPSGVDGVFMYTAAAVSPGVSPGELLASTITLTVVYAALAVVELVFIVRYVRGGVLSAMPELDANYTHDNDMKHDDPSSGSQRDDVLAFAY
jgi:cytochrome d ubiquinol oxidase subunit I